MTPSPGPRDVHPQPRAVSAQDRLLPERSANLWRLVAGPSAWALHFLLCYATAAVWCAKQARLPPSAGLQGTLWTYTAIALATIAWFGWRAWRHHAWGRASLPHDDPTAGDRHRFLGYATLLLCGLSFIAVLYSALAIAFVGSCR